MLTTIIPGLRDIRSPLATGLAWVALLWITAGDRVAHAVSELDVGNVSALFELTGKPTGVTLLLVAAYGVGDVLQVQGPPLGMFGNVLDSLESRLRAASATAPSSPMVRLGLTILTSEIWPVLAMRTPSTGAEWRQGWVQWKREQDHDLRRRREVVPLFSGGRVIGLARAAHPVKQLAHAERQDEAWQAFHKALGSRDDELAARVRLEVPDVHAEIERLRAESALRLSLFWPLAAIGAYATGSIGLAAIPLIVFAFAFAYRGLIASNRAKGLLRYAVMNGKVRHPLLDEINCRDIEKKIIPATMPPLAKSPELVMRTSAHG